MRGCEKRGGGWAIEKNNEFLIPRNSALLLLLMANGGIVASELLRVWGWGGC
jgi:hypothetical protein